MGLRRKINYSGLIVPIAFLAVWEASARYQILPPSLSAAPSKIVMVFFQLLNEGASLSMLFSACTGLWSLFPSVL